MANSHVTITLGRSGQKVVKDSWLNSAHSRGNAAPWPSGSKRSLVEAFGSSADYSLVTNKRMREDVSARTKSSGRMDAANSRLGRNDLRLKLTHRRVSKLIELENKGITRKELHEEVSRAIQSLESPDYNLSRSVPLSRGAHRPPQMCSMANSYASLPSNSVRARPQERNMGYFDGISTPGPSNNRLPPLPASRPIDSSRTARVLMSDQFDSSKPKGPMPTTSRHRPEPPKLVRELPPATGGMSRPQYQDNKPVTVASLLQSLGLGKYFINFQAEEIDMAALKQMGDGDLKELGIPMGPRKKILLYLQSQPRRPPAYCIPSSHRK